MDSLSLMSYSNTTSVDYSELNDCNEDNTYKDLAAYFNQIVRNSKTSKAKSAKRYHAKLDSNSNKTHRSTPPPTRNNNRNLFINDAQETTPRRSADRQSLKNQPQSTHNFQTQDFAHVNCSKNLPRVDFEEKLSPKLTFVKSDNKFHPERMMGPSYAEKTTYCRPAIDMYNQEFIYKTMERNARLKGLVKRLVLAREKEKQKVAWNNYINELKNKHRYSISEPRTIPNYSPDVNRDIIDDYYNTRFTWKQSNPCQNLLQDFYSASHEMSSASHKAPHTAKPLNYRPYIYDNNRYCFPTSSQARLMMNRERIKYQLPNRIHTRSTSTRYRGTPIFVEKEIEYPFATKPMTKKIESDKLLGFNKKYYTVRSSFVQTDFDLFDNSVENNFGNETFKDKYSRVNSNVERLKQKIMQTQNEVKYCSLTTIENKLDSLIHSINTFIVEIKSQKLLSDTKGEACHLSNNSLLNSTKSDTFGILRREQYVCGMVQDQPRSTMSFNEGKRRETIDEILVEEMTKSDEVKRNIEEILNKPSRDRPSVHITFDLPTKERATEITDSLFKTRHSNVVVEEIDGHEKRMTIAVNTDPLGLLALFRVSAEAVKQILSYMPHIDYYSYLSRLPLPQMSRNEISHYVCNICGAAFGRPSQLSDHIQQHNLGNVRDCCVCRHVLDMQRHRAGLFPCRHCGQRFTRAYCRQLHEQACARSLGRSPDVASSLVMLR